MGGGSDQGQDQGGTSPFSAYLANPRSANVPTWFTSTGQPSPYLQLTGLRTQLDCDPVEVEKTKNDLTGDAEELEPYVDLPAIATQAFGNSGVGQELDALATQAHGHLRGALATLTGALRGYAQATHSAHQALKDVDGVSEQQFRTSVNRITDTTGTALGATDDANQKAIDAAKKAEQTATTQPSDPLCTVPSSGTTTSGEK